MQLLNLSALQVQNLQSYCWNYLFIAIQRYRIDVCYARSLPTFHVLHKRRLNLIGKFIFIPGYRFPIQCDQGKKFVWLFIKHKYSLLIPRKAWNEKKNGGRARFCEISFKRSFNCDVKLIALYIFACLSNGFNQLTITKAFSRYVLVSTKFNRKKNFLCFAVCWRWE